MRPPRGSCCSGCDPHADWRTPAARTRGRTRSRVADPPSRRSDPRAGSRIHFKTAQVLGIGARLPERPARVPHPAGRRIERLEQQPARGRRGGVHQLGDDVEVAPRLLDGPSGIGRGVSRLKRTLVCQVWHITQAAIAGDGAAAIGHEDAFDVAAIGLDVGRGWESHAACAGA